MGKRGGGEGGRRRLDLGVKRSSVRMEGGDGGETGGVRQGGMEGREVLLSVVSTEGRTGRMGLGEQDRKGGGGRGLTAG